MQHSSAQLATHVEQQPQQQLLREAPKAEKLLRALNHGEANSVGRSVVCLLGGSDSDRLLQPRLLLLLLLTKAMLFVDDDSELRRR